MVETGERAPTFTAPAAANDIVDFDLEDRLDDAPLVLAFFPAAFTDVCSHELETFQERLDEFTGAGGSVVGVSTDSPYALREFRDQLGLSYPLVSDANSELVHAYGVAMDIDQIGLEEIARRAVFIIDGDGVVRYRWMSDEPGMEPDYDAVLAAIEQHAD